MTATGPFAALLGSARRRDLAPGETLFRQGDATTALFVVESGRVLLVRHTSEGVPVTVHAARAGETFAEAALFSDRYHCDAVAEVPSRVAVLPRGAVRQALGADPETAWGFMQQMAAQIQALRARLELRNVRSARERVLQYLALAPRGTIGPDRTLKQVAAEIGLTHEALYRTLAALEAEGRITRTACRDVRVTAMSRTDLDEDRRASANARGARGDQRAQAAARPAAGGAPRSPGSRRQCSSACRSVSGRRQTTTAPLPARAARSRTQHEGDTTDGLRTHR